MGISAFELSRIYGQGWNKAKKLLAGGALDADEAHATSLNPYRTVREAARWAEGFSEAIRSRAKPFKTAGGRAWRPAEKE